MAKKQKVQGISWLPVYLISPGRPWTISEEDLIDSVPVSELIGRLKPEEHLYLVDYASNPGHTRLTCLV